MMLMLHVYMLIPRNARYDSQLATGITSGTGIAVSQQVAEFDAVVYSALFGCWFRTVTSRWKQNVPLHCTRVASRAKMRCGEQEEK